MKNKKLMLVAVAAMGLVAAGTAGVGTAAWFVAVNESNATASVDKTLSITDPQYDIGTTLNLQIEIEEVDAAGKAESDDGYTTGGRGTLYLSSLQDNTLKTYYLDAAKSAIPYTPSGTINVNYTFVKVYKVTLKSPTTTVSGDDAVAVRGLSVTLAAARKGTSTALFDGWDAAYNTIDGKVETSATSIAAATVYTFDADLTSLAANTVLATKYMGVRVDGGSISGTGLTPTSSPVNADFTVSAAKAS